MKRERVLKVCVGRGGIDLYGRPVTFELQSDRFVSRHAARLCCAFGFGGIKLLTA
jgi:hypothetical protein